ncbi:MAG: hypothetical protein V1740_00785 [Candidatus Woesearchaeota archaeon]
MRNRKSQISVEFLFALGIILFIFIILIAFNFDRNQKVRETSDLIQLQDQCYEISNYLYSAYINTLNGERFSITIQSYYDFEISSDSRVVTVKLDDNRFAFCTFPFDVVRNPSYEAQFELVKGDVLIENHGRYIVMQNI